MEEWRVVAVHERYEVSDQGRVRNRLTGRVLAATPRKNGYVSVIFKDGKAQKRYYAHRLVAAAFIGELSEDSVVNHLNFTRHDNRACNLEITTTAENVAYSVAAGRMVDNGRNAPRGERHKLSKVTAEQVLEIRHLHSCGVTPTELGLRYGVVKQQIANIVKRVSWYHI